MDRKKLEAYQANKRLIARNQQKIDNEQMEDLPGIRGKVKGSSPDFPFIEQRFSVEMDDPVEAEKQLKRITRWKNEIRQAEAEVEEVERFVAGLRDVRDREIFTYRFIDGVKVKEIGKKVGYTHGRVCQIIKKYVRD